MEHLIVDKELFLNSVVSLTRELTMGKKYKIIATSIKDGIAYYKVLNNKGVPADYKASLFENVIVTFGNNTHLRPSHSSETLPTNSSIRKVDFSDGVSYNNNIVVTDKGRNGDCKSIVLRFTDTFNLLHVDYYDDYFALSIESYDNKEQEVVLSSDIEYNYDVFKNDINLFDKFFRNSTAFSWKCKGHKEFTNTNYNINVKYSLEIMAKHRNDIIDIIRQYGENRVL